MTPHLPGAPAPPGRTTTLLCHVTPADVDAMLDAYDSGMCDTSTANCLSRGIARALRHPRPVPLIRQGVRRAHVSLHGHAIPIPPEILGWLEEVETGSRKAPLEFTLELPVDLAPVIPVATRYPIVRLSQLRPAI